MNISLYFRPLSYDLGQPSSILLDPRLKKRFTLIHDTYTIDERVTMLKDNSYPLPPLAYAFANRDTTELEVVLKGIPRKSLIELCQQKSKEGNPCIYYAIRCQSAPAVHRILSSITYDAHECYDILAQHCASGSTLFQEILHSKHAKTLRHQYIPNKAKNTLIHTKDKNGRTPIQNAIVNNDLESLSWLLDGLSEKEVIQLLTQRDKAGKNGMYYAIKNKNKDMITLIKHLNTPPYVQKRINASQWLSLLSGQFYEGQNSLSALSYALYREGNDYDSPAVELPLRSYWHTRPVGVGYRDALSAKKNKENQLFKELLEGLSVSDIYECLMKNPDAISAGLDTSKDFLRLLRQTFKAHSTYNLIRNAIDDIFISGRCSSALKHIFDGLDKDQTVQIIQTARYSVDNLKYCPYAHDYNLTPFMMVLFNKDKEALLALVEQMDEDSLIEQLLWLNDNHESALEIALNHCPHLLEYIFAKLSRTNIYKLMFDTKNTRDLSMFEVGISQCQLYDQFCKTLGDFIRRRQISDVMVIEALDHMFKRGDFYYLHQHFNVRAHAAKLDKLLCNLPYNAHMLRFEWLSHIVLNQPQVQEDRPTEERLSLPHKLFCALVGPSYQDALQLLTRNHAQQRTHLINLMIQQGDYLLLHHLFQEIPFNETSKIKLIGAPDYHGQTPIMMAAEKGNWPVLKLLLDQVSPHKAAEILNQEDGFRRNTIMQLINHEHTHLLSPILEYFEQSKREHLICSREKNFYLLNILAARGQLHLFQLVLDSFDTPTRQRLLSQRDRRGRTPFLAALQAEQTDMAAAIQAMGGDVFQTQRAPQRRVFAPIDPTPVRRDAPPAWVAPPVIIPRQDDKKPVLNNAQSSHDSQVERDAANSAMNLSRRYGRHSVERVIDDISHWLSKNKQKSTDWQTAIRAIEHLKRNPELFMWRHQSTGITIKDALAYLWLGLSDKEAQKGVDLTASDIEERRKRVVDTLVNMQRAYNMDGHGNDHGGKDGVTCPGGGFNMLINGLSGAHDLVEVKIKVNDAVLSQRASVIAADLFIKMPDIQSMKHLWSKDEGLCENLWAKIGSQVQDALVREFGSQYSEKIRGMYDAYLQYMPPPPKVEKAFNHARQKTVKAY